VSQPTWTSGPHTIPPWARRWQKPRPSVAAGTGLLNVTQWAARWSTALILIIRLKSYFRFNASDHGGHDLKLKRQRKGSHWMAEEVERMTEMLSSHTSREIADELQRTVASVQQKALTLGLKMARSHKALGQDST
jgi:hypothetical protein